MIGSVKLFSTTIMLLSTAALCLTGAGCKPQAPDLERLRTVETNNEQLRQKIADMQKRIREAGTEIPDLKEQIDTRTEAINNTLAHKTELRRKETAVRLRYIELDTRLNEFRTEFNKMQKDIAQQTTAQP